MNDRERMICASVVKFRKKIGWSQKDFAAVLGVSLNQWASVEYGRTPLRYDVAWKMRILFKVSLEWLSVGEFGPDSVFNDELPPPDSTGLPESALLSEVSDKVNGSVPEFNYAAKRPKEIKLDKKEMAHRAFVSFGLREQIDVWIAKVPDGYTGDFCDKFFELAKKYLGALPKEPDALVNARLDALMWEEMRRELRQRLRGGTPLQKSDLTESEMSIKTDDVKSLLPKLLERLKKASSEPGKKSELAKYLGVPLASVSRWLSGDREPGGEITLKMFHWVEQQERQK